MENDNSASESASKLAGYNKRNLYKYIVFCVRILCVTGITILVYLWMLDYLWQGLVTFAGVPSADASSLKSAAAGFALKVLGGVLLCWRSVKVFALLGWPFGGGAPVIATGYTHPSGERISLGYIGDFHMAFRYGGERVLYYAIIARSHRTSDKLVRYRVEGLFLLLPFDYVFSLTESQWRFAKNAPGLVIGFREQFQKRVGLQSFITHEDTPPSRVNELDVDLDWYFYDIRQGQVRHGPSLVAAFFQEEIGVFVVRLADESEHRVDGFAELIQLVRSYAPPEPVDKQE